MKWSKGDLERFQRSYGPELKIDSVEGNIVVYSVGKWKYKARLLKGGKAMTWTIHLLEDNGDLFE